MFFRKKIIKNAPDIKRYLNHLKDPLTGNPITHGDLLEILFLEKENRLYVTLHVEKDKENIYSSLSKKIKESLYQNGFLKDTQIFITMTSPQPSPAKMSPLPAPGSSLPGISHILAIGSGKGGVGKSTTTVMLAYTLQERGLKVGLLDADIYGPSLPTLLNLKGKQPTLTEDNRLVPLEREGLKVMSIGFLVEEETPLVWRGPMLQKALHQFLYQVAWGDLDVLLIDLPPGTGDVPLSLSRTLNLTGAIVVSTPQDLALLEAKKAIEMFRKLNVPLLGILENMSSFICPHCHEESAIFSQGGARRIAQDLHLPFLAEVPLNTALREKGDAGTLSLAHLSGEVLMPYRDAAECLLESLKNISKTCP